MNVKQLIAAVAVFAAAGSTMAAQTYPYVTFDGFQGSKTRAEINADLQQPQSNGAYVAGGQEFTAPDAGFAASKTRAQVTAELRHAQDEGAYLVGGAELPGQLPAARLSTSRLASN